jgi:aminoglycoside phosphotransferase (APT) family kinase protein
VAFEPYDAAHNRSAPSREGLAAMVREIAPRSKIGRIRRLKGGLGAATHAVVLTSPKGTHSEIVLKRYGRSGHDAPTEWAKTCLAQRLPVASPGPIAFDAKGRWFGAPAMVTSKLEGRPLLSLAGDDRAYREIAESILAVASVSTGRLPAAVRGPAIGTRWRPPPDLPQSALVDRAVERVLALRRAALRQRKVMAHGDLHPGNMLWTRRRLRGLVDWGSANLSFATRDVVYCRTEVAVLFGLREADRFLAVYEQTAGERTEHLEVWDVMQGLVAVRWVQGWAYAYREQGRHDLTGSIAQRRAYAFLKRAVARA